MTDTTTGSTRNTANPTGRRGIILAGGTGSRLHPVTIAVSKQLLPVYDKPMIYYPLSTLMLAGIDEVLIITTPHDSASFERLLGDGSQWGMRIDYATQAAPNGLAEAFLIGESFLDGRPACLILGDNLFYGSGFSRQLQEASSIPGRASLFAQQVADPERYGVLEMTPDGQAISIEEKPEHPRSNWAVTGLYFFPADVSDAAKSIEPSERGELEITSVIQWFLDRDQVSVTRLDRGFAWLDTGTFMSLIEASEYVRVIEQRQRTRIASPEEVAFRMGFIDADHLLALAEPLRKSGYGTYLAEIARAEGN